RFRLKFDPVTCSRPSSQARLVSNSQAVPRPPLPAGDSARTLNAKRASRKARLFPAALEAGIGSGSPPSPPCPSAASRDAARARPLAAVGRHSAAALRAARRARGARRRPTLGVLLPGRLLVLPGVALLGDDRVGDDRAAVAAPRRARRGRRPVRQAAARLPASPAPLGALAAAHLVAAPRPAPAAHGALPLRAGPLLAHGPRDVRARSRPRSRAPRVGDPRAPRQRRQRRPRLPRGLQARLRPAARRAAVQGLGAGPGNPIRRPRAGRVIVRLAPPAPETGPDRADGHWTCAITAGHGIRSAPCAAGGRQRRWMVAAMRPQPGCGRRSARM
ncbi:hypothetical protein DFJ74DRAFT_723521, partial [Hyaloraphidium curvatum]